MRLCVRACIQSASVILSCLPLRARAYAYRHSYTPTLITAGTRTHQYASPHTRVGQKRPAYGAKETLSTCTHPHRSPRERERERERERRDHHAYSHSYTRTKITSDSGPCRQGCESLADNGRHGKPAASRPPPPA